MFENYLIDCCAPTLASLKSGSLFNCKCVNGTENIEDCVQEWNDHFVGTGIRMYLLRKTRDSALVYVYRESALGRTLKDPEIREFLTGYGYECCSGCCGRDSCCREIEECLCHLKDRITGDHSGDEMRFPHEIGVFLDYPLQDVKGFISNEGKNCKYVGIWKVYGDEIQAKRKFAKYRKCIDVYSRLWRSGRRDILQLTVAG